MEVESQSCEYCKLPTDGTEHATGLDCLDAMEKDRDRMRAALNLVLTFYGAPYWDPDLRSDWKEATGSDEATTKVLCDHIRKVLAESQPSAEREP
jgi:hypothetical protein